MLDIWIASSVFIFTYFLIANEKTKITKPTAALSGAMLLIIFKVISQKEAVNYIDFNTIGLLIGMMIIIAIIKKTGLFQYLAIKATKKANGEPWKIMLSFGLITAISSALLDNVTTVLLIAPITIVISDTLEINPIPFLITEILMANIGGTATMIGDPPNVMIGSNTHLTFLDFIINLGPIVLIILIIAITILFYIFSEELKVKSNLKDNIKEFNAKTYKEDKKLLVQSLIILTATITGFMLHNIIHIQTASIALAGAAILMLISDVLPEHIYREIEWKTIFFFAGLFILVGGLEKVGLLEQLAQATVNFTKGHYILTTIFLLWISALASTIIDNIPFVATMIPVIHSINQMTGNNFDITPLWWALSLGACLGGNGSLIGASANVVVADIANKHDYKINFKSYLKIGFPIMIISIFIASIYIYFRYLF